MSLPTYSIRPAVPSELEAINRVIEAAVMNWKLPERVQRLSLSSVCYTRVDFDHLEIMIAEDERKNILGVMAWERANPKDAPEEQPALLLHGLYVDPASQHQGIGRQLFRSAEQAARTHGYEGILVKAQEKANDFFIAQGMERLQVKDASRHYANRFWKKVS